MNAILALSSVVIKELYRRKDFYVLFIFTVLITLVMASANIFNSDSITGYLKEISLLLIWISALFMAVGTAARQIPAEIEQRTIFPLLAKPVSRAQVILGKFLGTWLACGISLLVFYLFLDVVSASREHEWHLVNYFQAAWMQWMFLGMVIALVLLGSIVFAAPSSNATICIILVMGILWLGKDLGEVAAHQKEPVATITYIVFFTIPQFAFFDLREFLIHDAPGVGWLNIGLASAYSFAYTAFFLFATWVMFRRKTLNK